MSVTQKISKAAKITGWIVGGLPAVLLGVTSAFSALGSEQAKQGLVDAGYPESALVPLGWVTVLSACLYLIPWTSGLGAILLTGYLGGAVATHVRLGDPWYMSAPAVAFGVLLWVGLVLRNKRARGVLPFVGGA